MPDALRPVLGKHEINRSLGTRDASEAKPLLPIERLKIDAEFERARRSVRWASPPQIGVPDVELWHLAARWFVREEKRSARRSFEDDIDRRETAEVKFDELEHVERWEDTNNRVHGTVDELFMSNGVQN